LSISYCRQDIKSLAEADENVKKKAMSGIFLLNRVKIILQFAIYAKKSIKLLAIQPI
jgi:hypothetical protein